MGRRAITLLVFFALALSIVAAGIQMYSVHSLLPDQVTAKAASPGMTRFCINREPSIAVPCNASLSQDQQFTCQLTLSDADDNNVTVESSFVTDDILFNVSQEGFINFTPGNDAVGNHTVIFTASDNTGCANEQDLVQWEFSVANLNDPPFLVQDVPDVRFPVNTTLSAFFLDNYFSDPDGDVLNYTRTTPSGVSVTVHPNSEVTFTGNTCLPDGVLIRFTATDPFGLSAESNVVEITVTCNPPEGGGEGGSTSGGGGGAGGGSSSTCKSQWECQDWWACLPTGYEWQRCYDMQGCEEDRYLKRECEYTGPPAACLENWLCEEWGQCFLNGTQHRTCEDLNACGSMIVKPSEMQECEYLPTCNDGIKNGNETGVDCGGQCAACSLVERPSPISGDAGLATWLILLIILAILISSGLLRYYRAQIAQTIAAAGFLLRHPAYKEILLDAVERKTFFENIARMERRIASAGTEGAYGRIAALISNYFQQALALPVEMLSEEVEDRIRNLALREETATLMRDMFGKLEIVEQENLDYDEFFVRATLEQLRTLVCLTSEYEMGEIARPIDEIPVTEEMPFYDEIYVRIVNILRALQFGQLDVARTEYLAMLNIYDPLTIQEKEAIYPDLRWIFCAVKFGSEITGSRQVDKSGLAA